jgi:TonB-dependent SusC/RagA subfamily outer membrane receptor
MLVMKYIFCLHVSLFIAFAGNAQLFNQNLKISSWKIDVEANQFTAKTVMEITFCNDNGRVEAEALYQLHLKPHQAITHFELMLGDKYRDGSIEERWKATSTYNSIVGKRVDPAVLQKGYGGNYSLNVYPVPAKGCRSVRITIEEKLPVVNSKLVYSLPVVHTNTVASLEISFRTNNKIDTIHEGVLSQKIVPTTPIKFSNKYNFINDSINVHMNIEQEAACVSRFDSLYTFTYRAPQSSKDVHDIHPRTIAAFWDLSRASQFNDFSLDVAFLKKYTEQHQIGSIEVVGFNQEQIFKEVYAVNELDVLLTRLQNTKLVGASNLSVVVANRINADVAFVFSKGTSHYNRQIATQNEVPLFAMVQNKSASNLENLNKLVGNSGGKTLYLDKEKISNLVKSTSVVYGAMVDLYINYQRVPFKQIDSVNGKFAIIHATSVEPIEQVHLGLKYSSKNKLKPIKISNNCPSSATARIDVFDEFEGLMYLKPRYLSYYSNYDWAYQLRFGKKHRIVTYQTAYLVLERIEDYINYGITPPKEIEQQVINDPKYVKRKTQDPVYYAAALNTKEKIINSAYQYNSRFAKYGKASYKSKEDILLDKIKISDLQQKQIIPATGSNSYVSRDKFDRVVSSEGKSIEEVVVVGYGASAKKSMTSSAVTVVQNRELVGGADLNEILAGRVAGIQVVKNSAIPGSGSELRIRGASTLGGSTAPLYVVDGMALNTSDDLRFINIADIEHITVLKGANATVLYGARGANGVIIIESKKGKVGRPTWGKYKLSDMEDEDYTLLLKEAKKATLYRTYKELSNTYGHHLNFHIDAATLLYKQGDKFLAREILLSALELTNDVNNHVAFAFMLDEFGFHKDAQQIYRNQSASNPYVSITAERNIAVSQLMSGKIQDAADTYYSAIISNNYDYYHFNDMIIEFRALLAAYKGQIDTSKFEVVFEDKVLPVKHIYINNNNGYINVCNTNKMLTNSPSRYNNMNFYFDSIQNKTQEIVVAIYGSAYGYGNTILSADATNIVRVIEFENFGLPNQKLVVKNHNVVNQFGEVVLQKVTL